MDRWLEMELFVHTAELGSISRAAERLEMSNPAASRYLTALEKRLGARLIERNTRRLFLTDVGRVFYQRCKNLLGELRDAESEVNATVLNPVGTLRVTASLSFSMLHITPLLARYRARYPNVKVHVEVANRYFDLIDEGIDVAIRTREYEPDTSITVRRLAETRRILAASPSYLDQYGVPKTLEDLQQHRLLIYTLAKNPNELRFSRDGQVSTISVNGYLDSNDGQILRAAALDGLGILIQPKYILYNDLVAGRLIPILDEWDLPRLTINVAYLSRKHLSAKVRSFIEFLTEDFSSMNYEKRWTQ